MTTYNRTICAVTLLASLFTGQAFAATLQDHATSAADQLSSMAAGGGENGGLSLSSLTSLLNGNSQALSANSLTNAAGVLQYCMKNKLVNDTNNVESQVLDKLGLNKGNAQAEKPDYSQGLMGMLNTGEGKQLDLNSLGNSPLAEKVKTKACDFVLKQGASFLS